MVSHVFNFCYLFLISWLFGISYPQTFAQESYSPILIIYDASGSMWGQIDGVSKKEIGAKVLIETVNNIPASQPVGLMVYGHRREKDCDDIEIMAGLENLSRDKISKAIHSISPLGRTPLARSVTMAINSIKSTGQIATIILITDGIESCDGDICEVVSSAKLGGIDIKLHIVGFGLKEEETEVLRCAVDAGGGRYFSADNADQLSSVLQEVTKQTIDDPLENFSVVALKNKEPVDAWVKAYQSGTKIDVGGSRTYRDTGRMYLPPGKYDVEIRPLENTDISERTIQIEVKSGEPIHRTISFDGAKLDVTSTNNGEGWDSVIKVFEAGTTKVVAATRTYGHTKALEVDPGTYEIEFQAMVIKGLQFVHKTEGVEVAAGESLPIEHNFQSGRALIGVQTSGGELIDATVGFTEVSSGKGITGSRTYTSSSSNPREFILSPGRYQVKIVSLGEHKGSTTSLEVTIIPGQTIEKTITF